MYSRVDFMVLCERGFSGDHDGDDKVRDRAPGDRENDSRSRADNGMGLRENLLTYISLIYHITVIPI